MGKLNGNSRIRAGLTIMLIALMFGVLMIVNLLTPLIRDDYIYSKGLIFGTEIPVRSVADLFQSAANMYKTCGGRVFSIFHNFFFSQIGKTSTAVVNSAAYLLTVGLLYLLIRGRGRNSVCLFIGINLSLWGFVPELGQDIFWVSGTTGYLLSMPPILGMLWIYQRSFDAPASKDGAVRCALMALLGVIAGWQMENSSIVVPFIIFIALCLWKRQGVKPPKWAWFGFAGSVLGYGLLLIAPGNYNRYAFIEPDSLSLAFKLALITYYWIMFAGVLTTLFVLGMIRCCRSRPDAARKGAVFAVAALVSAYCLIAAPSSPERTWFITISLMTVAAGVVLREAIPWEKVSCGAKTTLCVAALAILGAMAADTILASYDIHEQFVQREEIIMAAKQNGETVVEVPVYKLKYPLKANRYALYGLDDIGPDPNSLHDFNRYAAWYYGVDAIIGTNGE